MKPLSKDQLITINVLVTKLHINKDDKAIMVSGFTGGRATSTKDLYLEEAMKMITHLKSFDPEEKSADKMRKAIIAMAHELGWKLPNGKADMVRIDNWCKKQGKNKGLNSYTLKELPNLVTGFKKMYEYVIEKI